MKITWDGKGRRMIDGVLAPEGDITDLYKQAVAFGKEQEAANMNKEWPDQAAYFAAWFAGRRAAGALLEEAKEMGLTAEQIERLTVVACRVAYD